MHGLRWISVCLVIAISTSYSLSAMAEGVAKAIIVKGKVFATLKDGSKSELKKDGWLPEGAKVNTEAGSFAKLLFIDKSTMNVGPNSIMEIASFPKAEPGVLNLIQGEVRSKVTKNYMDMKDQDKSKLFIKTKTAAMGVRGTDFIVGFMPDSGATMLDVVSGAVAMANIEPGMVPDQKALEAAVSSPSAVMVEKGFSSEVSGGGSKPVEPKPIPATKLENLKTNENSLVSSSAPSGSLGNSDNSGNNKNQENKGEDNKELKADNSNKDDKDEKDKDKKDDKPATAAAPGTAPSTAVLPPGMTADMALNSEPALEGSEISRDPASIDSSEPAGTESLSSSTAPTETQTDFSAPPSCTDVCQCYGIGCTVASASGDADNSSLNNLDGNALSTISGSIEEGLQQDLINQVETSATVQFNITTQ